MSKKSALDVSGLYQFYLNLEDKKMRYATTSIKTIAGLERKGGIFNSAVTFYSLLMKHSGIAICLMLFFVFLSVPLLPTQQSAAQSNNFSRVDGQGIKFSDKIGQNDEVMETIPCGEFVHEGDSLALVAFYHALHGEQWVDNSGWLEAPVADWVGIYPTQCEEDNTKDWRVTGIEFPPFNMTVPGEMPMEIADLEYLSFLRMRDNLVGPTVPHGLAQIPAMRQLEMRDNIFSSEIPFEAFGKLEDLRILEFRHNFITGDFPSWMGEVDSEGNLLNFPRLQRFRIDENFMTGEIPASLANMDLWHFLIAHNSFTGPAPDWEGGDAERSFYIIWRINNNNFDPYPFPDWMCEPEWINAFREISIHHTNVEGTIPECVGEMQLLEILNVGGDSDEIGGTIPEALKIAPSLRQFNLHGGNFTGPMPEWIYEMPGLTRFHSRNVGWTGTLPASYAESTTLNDFALEGSQVEGGIPSEWESLSFNNFHLVNNPNMTIGDVPDWISSAWPELSTISLENSGITGSIPESWQNLVNLVVINLNNNPEMTGQLPEWLQGKVNMKHLNVSHSGFDIDQIPEYLLDWGNVNSIQMGGYGIEGEIPEWINTDNFDHASLLISLNKLALDGNSLSGEIPSNIGTLKFLDSLNLANNQLSGELPSNFGSIGQHPPYYHLEALVLSGNENLTGLVPDEIVNNSHLRVFEIDGTDLCISAEVYSFLEGIPERAERRYPAYYSVKPATDGYSEVDGNFCMGHLSVDPEENVAHQLRLHGNYPNPFNPATIIEYEIPANAGNVSLQVYNVIGQRVATLVNDQLAEGRYEATFDAGGLSSGSYVYRLAAGDKVLTQQMMLIK